MWYPADHVLGSRRNGVNHVGMETPFWAQGKTEPERTKTYPVTSPALLDWYATTMGMRSARIVFSWEAVQNNPDPLPAPPFAPNVMGEIDPAAKTGGYKEYWDDLVKLVIGFIDRGIYVTICPWQYRPPSPTNPIGDTDITYRGQVFEPEHFADFWGKFATAINKNVAAGFPLDPSGKFPSDATRPRQLAFDLINEPHEGGGGAVGITIAKWKTCAQRAIDAIRANPVNTNAILVEGMSYASAHLDKHHIDPTHVLWETLSDPLSGIAISAHCYDGTRILPDEAAVEKPFDALRTACKDLLDWARPRGLKVHIGEVAVDAGVGGCSDLPHAQSKWDDWNKFCLENDDVLIGWNWWGNTSKDWCWSDEGSCKVGQPNVGGGRNWALTHDDGATSTVHADLIKASIPVPDLYIRDNTADDGTKAYPVVPGGSCNGSCGRFEGS
jgi:hypothetical protein